jgi:hypothetical protein
MRVALIVLLVVHGAIHLLGFVKAWGLAAVPQLTGRTVVALSGAATRVVGLLWLAAFAFLLGAAAMRVARSPSWWTLAAAGVVLSQALVVLQWHDAKAGTAANVILALAVTVSGATARFEGRAGAEARELFARATGADGASETVRTQHLAGLPAPARRWLARAGVVGKPLVSTVRLRQRGQLHTAPDGPWLPVDAVQYFGVSEPGFVWWMESRMMKVLPVAGRDKYVGGRGEMLVKAGGLFDVANERGDKIDQGAMLRYLAEIIWFPSAALRPYVSWEAVDDGRAKATMRHEGKEVSAVLTVDAEGRVTEIEARRFFGGSGGLERWGGRCSEWRVVRGVEIPVRGKVIWFLEGGDFEFFDWEITDVELDTPTLYEAR